MRAAVAALRRRHHGERHRQARRSCSAPWPRSDLAGLSRLAVRQRLPPDQDGGRLGDTLDRDYPNLDDYSQDAGADRPGRQRAAEWKTLLTAGCR